jgi:hypothetical protein
LINVFFGESKIPATTKGLSGMPYLSKIYDLAEYDYRLRYAIRTIVRDRIANEGAFKSCFEMGDGEEIILAILRRGLKNPKLRGSLESSHFVNLNQWLLRYPEFAMAYQIP